MVKVYTATDCPWCEKVKKYLTVKGVEFENINVEDTPSARKELKALTQDINVPTTTKDGAFVVGFEKEKLDLLLGL